MFPHSTVRAAIVRFFFQLNRCLPPPSSCGAAGPPQATSDSRSAIAAEGTPPHRRLGHLHRRRQRGRCHPLFLVSARGPTATKQGRHCLLHLVVASSHRLTFCSVDAVGPLLWLPPWPAHQAGAVEPGKRIRPRPRTGQAARSNRGWLAGRFWPIGQIQFYLDFVNSFRF
jgi:hypothetical protein